MEGVTNSLERGQILKDVTGAVGEVQKLGLILIRLLKKGPVCLWLDLEETCVTYGH